MKIAAIIVAAGRSSRFGDGNKLVAHLNGRPLISYAVAAAAASPVDDIVLVIAPDGAAIAGAAGNGRWRTVVNAQASAGLSSSIQTGLSALPAGIGGALIMLADMPGVTSELIAKLCDAFREREGRAIVFPQTANGRQGNPVLWPRALFADLKTITGDAGGKAILDAHPDLQHSITISGDAARFDVDTADDLARAEIAAQKQV